MPHHKKRYMAKVIFALVKGDLYKEAAAIYYD